MKMHRFLVIPLFLGGCAQGPDHTVERSIPAHYVEGSFVISSEAERSDSELTKMAEGVGSVLG